MKLNRLMKQGIDERQQRKEFNEVAVLFQEEQRSKKSDDMLPQWKRSFHNEWPLKVSQGTQHPEGGCAGC